MNKLVILVILVLISFSAAFAVWKFLPSQNKPTPKTTKTDSTTLVPTPTTTPLTEETKTEVGGLITEVGKKVSYKGSTVIKVNTTDVYVTSTTQIYDKENKPIDISALKKDVKVQVVGVPAEGGIEALKVTAL